MGPVQPRLPDPVGRVGAWPRRARSWRRPARTQIDKIHPAELTRRRLGHQDLTAVIGGHHPRGAIEHRTEIVAFAQLGLAGRQPHPHRQLQRPLGGHRRIDRKAQSAASRMWRTRRRRCA